MCPYVPHCSSPESCCFIDRCMEASKWARFSFWTGEKISTSEGKRYRKSATLIWYSFHYSLSTWASIRSHESLRARESWPELKLFDNSWQSTRSHERWWECMRVDECAWQLMKVHDRVWTVHFSSRWLSSHSIRRRYRFKNKAWNYIRSNFYGCIKNNY